MTGRLLWSLPAMLFLTLLGTAAIGVDHTHVSPDWLESASCTCRPATEAECHDISLSPDGWIQESPRESFNRGTVPLPLVPDWVGTRTRATGGLAWGDADNDDDLDLFVGTYYANMYPPIEDYYNFIYMNVDGVLEDHPSWISLDEKHTCEVWCGLINNDQYPDFFVANGGFSLQPSQVFYGRDDVLPITAGWFSNDDCWTIGCAFCDFDDDGDNDVATANQGTTNDYYRPTHLFRNNGVTLETTPFWSSSQVGITNGADWADMNGDELPDLAVSGWVDWETGVFLNTGTTLETDFAWTTGHPERTSKRVGWALVDEDPYPDLAVGGNGDPDCLYGNEGTILGANAVWESTESYTGCQDLVWIDIDRDGDEDLAMIHFSTGHARIYLNNDGTLSTTADWQYDAASSGTAIAFGDVNGDDWPDLALGVANGPIALFLNLTTPQGIAESSADLPDIGVLRVKASPNPFTADVRIVVESGSPFGADRIDIFDLAGRHVTSLRTATEETSRVHMASWDPLAGAADGQTPGIYFVLASGRDSDGRRLKAQSKIIWLGR